MHEIPSGMGLKQLPPVAYMKKMFKLLSHHYPMRLGHVLFTNVGPSVMLCWRVVSPLLQARTKAKMHLIPSTWVQIVCVCVCACTYVCCVVSYRL